MALQRTFSGFPAGCPGVSLLVLRLLVGGAASLQSSLLIAANLGWVITGVTFLAGLFFVTGIALIIGFMTPIVSVLLCAGALLLTLNGSAAGHLPLFDSGMARLEFVAMSAALVCLGPGALSLDARLYGRREIEVGNGS
jgi:uncharacterized membrane protein YphA (DoxX/SURF4 family)